MIDLPEVQAALKDFLFVELYTDRGTPEDDKSADLQMKRYGTSTLPLYVVQAPDGRVLDKFGGGRISRSEILEHLRKAATALQAGAPPPASPSPRPTPPPVSPSPSPKEEHGKGANFFQSLAPAEADSRASGRPLLIEFTGEN